MELFPVSGPPRTRQKDPAAAARPAGLFRTFRREETGSLMVDGMIAMLLTIMVLVFLMSIGFLLYQQWIVSTVANDTAARLAQRYPYLTAEMVSGYVSEDDANDVPLMRYLGSDLEAENGVRGKSFALSCLSQSSLATPVSTPAVTVSVPQDSLGRRHVEVTITAEYEIPFGGALTYFGLDGTLTYHATGRAACIDLLDYVTSVEAAVDIPNMFESMSKFEGAISSIVSTVRSIADLFS